MLGSRLRALARSSSSGTHNMIHGHNMSQLVKTTDLCFKMDSKSVIFSDGSYYVRGSYYVYHWSCLPLADVHAHQPAADLSLAIGTNMRISGKAQFGSILVSLLGSILGYWGHYWGQYCAGPGPKEYQAGSSTVDSDQADIDETHSLSFSLSLPFLFLFVFFCLFSSSWLPLYLLLLLPFPVLFFKYCVSTVMYVTMINK